MIEKEFARHLKQFSTAPIIFVGAGISRRYLGTDNWEGLLRTFSQKTGKAYEYYSSKAGGRFDTIASLIAEDFFNLWWSDSQYSKNREIYKDYCKHTDSPLKIEVAQYINEKLEEALEKPNFPDEIAALKEIKVDGIITTNWDIFLENMFPCYKVYIGQQDLIFNKPQGIAEIYKIHGCATNPNSLIFTENDYTIFQQQNPYLAAKLLTLFVEHPIVFLGYSITDGNIQSLLKAITDCLDQEGINRLQDRLIFIEWQKGETGEFLNHTFTPSQGKTFPVKRIKIDSFLPIYNTLATCNRKFSASVLRQLKEHVYNLFLETEPKGNLYVQDISAAPEDNNIDVVFGIGAINQLQSKGYIPVTREDLARNVIFNEQIFDAEKILRVVQKNIPGTYTPIFKYLREGGYETVEAITAAQFHKKVIGRAKQTQESFCSGKISKRITEKTTFLDLKKYDVDDIIHDVAYLKKDNINMDELLVFIKEHFDNKIGSENALIRSTFYKLVCLYDYLKYS